MNLLERRLRWARQQAVEKGLISNVRRNWWELTESATDTLKRCKPGVVLVLYETPTGQALWARAEDAVGVVEDGCANLIFFSPPYPLLTQKAYGNRTEAEHLEWLVGLCRRFADKITPDGSICLNIADVQREPGIPTLSLYPQKLAIALVEDVGLHLCQRFYWQNPSKLPSGQFITIRRERCVADVEEVLWFAKTAFPKSRQRAVLRPYSEAMRKLIAKGGQRAAIHASGHDISENGFSKDNGGSIARALLSFPNTASNDAYSRFCRENNLPIHPARFPKELPAHFIKMLTDPRDFVWDPMAGSGVTAQASDELDREWLISDASLTYLQGSRGRFQHYRTAAAA